MKAAPLVLGLLVAAMGPAAMAADDPCTRFKWDVSQEVQLFQQAPAAIAAGAGISDAPLIQTQTLYEARLQPQEGFGFAAPPSKKMLDDGAHAGLFRFRVTAAGHYRVAVDAGFWLDIVADGTPLDSLDFNGSTQCAGPRKVVVFDLPADTDLLLQFSAANAAQARFSVTQVAAAAE